MRRSLVSAMRVFIASDHAAFDGRVALRDALQKTSGAEFAVVDLGCDTPERCNYPDYASRVCKELQADPAALGILVCGSGIGMSMAANKFKGVRAALCHNAYTARIARSNFGANVLCMGARTTGPDILLQSAKEFIAAKGCDAADPEPASGGEVVKCDHDGPVVVLGVTSASGSVTDKVVEEARMALGEKGKVLVVSGPGMVTDVCNQVTARSDGTVRGILVSEAAVDVAIAANKHKGIRAAVTFEEYTSAVTRQHNDANVLCLGTDSVSGGLLLSCVRAYLTATFEGGRHADRIALVSALDAGRAQL